MARMDLSELSAEDRASLYRATRQFDAALDIYELELSDHETHPQEAEYRGLTINYLRTAVALDNSTARVLEFLKAYAQRSDVPYYLKQRFAYWREVLQNNTAALRQAPTLAFADSLFERATRLSLTPGSRIAAVEDFLAARLMRSYLSNNPELPGDIRASIYFRLAVIALRTAAAAPAVPEMEMLLVAAIQAAPDTATARSAYALLEEHGYIHDEHLAGEIESRILVDMQALKLQAGIRVQN